MKFMKNDLVIGIDSSTTATKAIALDASGNNVAEGSCPVALSSPQPGYYEQDPSDWWSSAVTALQMVVRQVGNARIKAVAIANQRETFTALDMAGDPVRPAIIWLDERCRDEVDRFAGIIGEERIHRITGKPKDYAPVVYRLAWMKEHEYPLYKKTAKFCDVHAYLVYRLTGFFGTSYASADPLGIFDLEKKKWSAEILGPLEIVPGQLPETFSPGTVLGEVTAVAAEATGLQKGTPVVAGGGDGQAAGTGVNAMSAKRAYLNMGTAVVAGIYVSNYITDKAFRTMAACSAGGYYCETSLRAGTFLIDWFIQNMLGINTDRQKDIYRILEEEAEQISPGSEGVFTVPYWNAVMNPYWDPDARGIISGLSASHRRGHLYRSIMEGIAMEQSLASGLAEKAAGIETEEYALIGGGSKSRLWSRIIADVCNKRVVHMASGEASSLGAAIAAAVAAGWFSSFEEAAEAMTHVTSVTEPIRQNVILYNDLKQKYREIYPALNMVTKR